MKLLFDVIRFGMMLGACAFVGSCAAYVSTHGGWITVIPELLK